MMCIEVHSLAGGTMWCFWLIVAHVYYDAASLFSFCAI